MKFLIDFLFGSNNNITVQVNINPLGGSPVNRDLDGSSSPTMYNQVTSSGDSSGDDTEGDPVLQK